MARISGVDLPREKRVEIGITYIYGIGRPTATKILKATGINPDTRVKDLTEEDISNINKLVNLRRRTRVGMGTCQGGLCACRAAGMLVKSHNCAEKAKNDMVDFVQERWKGMNPISWGDTMNEAQFMSWIYEGVCGLNENNNDKNEDVQ